MSENIIAKKCYFVRTCTKDIPHTFVNARLQVHIWLESFLKEHFVSLHLRVHKILIELLASQSVKVSQFQNVLLVSSNLPKN